MRQKSDPHGQFAVWNAVAKLAVKIPPRVRAQGSSDMWPIQGLAVRTASISAAIAALVKQCLWAEAFVLGRTLMEIEITIKWLTMGADASERRRDYVETIKHEQARLARKIATGASVTSQVIGDLMGERLRKETARAEQPARDANSTPADVSIRSRAQATMLEDNYDFVFWQMSCYAHAHALSAMEFAPAELDLTIRKFFSGNVASGYVRTVVDTGLPCQILHTMDAANNCLSLGMTDDLEHAWQLWHQAMARSSKRLNLEFRNEDELPPRAMRVMLSDGTHKDYVPKAGAANGPRTKRHT